LIDFQLKIKQNNELMANANGPVNLTDRCDIVDEPTGFRIIKGEVAANDLR